MPRWLILFLALPCTWTKLPDNWETRTATAKQELLWNKIKSHAYKADALPKDYTTAKKKVATNDSRVFDPEFLKDVFLHFSDEMKDDHPKLVFPMGVVLKTELVINDDSPYSGIFKSGGIGIMRLASFMTPGALLTTTCAVKILIDGWYSQSILTEHRTRGRNGTRVPYFGQDLFTAYDVDIDTPVDELMGDAFTNTTFVLGGDDPLDHPINNANLGLVEQSRIQSNGENETEVVAPYRLRYVPAKKVNPIVNTVTQDFRKVLLNGIPADVELFQVEAQSEPGCEDWLPIGHIFSRSKPVASFYGDQKLFFRQARRQWDKDSGLQQECEHKGTTGLFDVPVVTPPVQRGLALPTTPAAPASSDENADSDTQPKDG